MLAIRIKEHGGPDILQVEDVPLPSPEAAERQDLLCRASDVLGWLAAGRLKVRVAGKFKLSEASQAHRMIENRGTTGKLLLIP